VNRIKSETAARIAFDCSSTQIRKGGLPAPADEVRLRDHSHTGDRALILDRRRNHEAH
jgi:hypothetical protein